MFGVGHIHSLQQNRMHHTLVPIRVPDGNEGAAGHLTLLNGKHLNVEIWSEYLTGTVLGSGAGHNPRVITTLSVQPR